MGDSAVSFPITSTPGAYPGEGQGRLVNCRARREGDVVYWRSCAGLAPFVTLPTMPVRGMMASGVFLYVVAGDVLYRVAKSGAIEALAGRVPVSGRVYLAQNNAQPAQIVVATSVDIQYLKIDQLRPLEDGDLPSVVTSVSRVGGYLVFSTALGEIWATNLNALDVSGLSFARAESDPDGIVRGITSRGVYYAMGTSTIEAWQDVGAEPFPLSRASTVIPVGLAGAEAIAGVDGEWDGAPIFVASDHTVRILAGFETQKISTPDIERLIARTPAETLRACVYSADGVSFWALSSDDWTWEYDAGAGTWTERESAGMRRWRVAQTARQWGDWFAADVVTGAIYRVDPTRRDEAGATLNFGADSAPAKAFPNRAAIAAAVMEFTLGHGEASRSSPTQSDPNVMISWSLDGGATWHGPLHRSLGRQGKFIGAARVNRLGLASHHGVRLRWRVSDPVPVSFQGATIQGETRRP